MNWFTRLLPSIKAHSGNHAKKDIPEGVWNKCEECQAILYQAELEHNLFVCPKCGFHMSISARKRLESFLDEGEIIEIAAQVKPIDHLNFKEGKQKYKDRLKKQQHKTGETEALIVLQGTLLGLPLVASSFDFAFIGGSMGSAVGERFVQGVQKAIEQDCPFVCFTASGGARMQEGLISLFQMAKTSAVLAKLAEKQLPYIVVLTNPTMGGVSASLAMLGDIIIAEPNAMIGFSGLRVIQDTIHQTLPPGFQRSNFLLEHGAIDMIIDRREMRHRIAGLLSKLTGQVNRGVAI